MRLTKFEKETIILFNESEDEASIYTYNAGLKNKKPFEKVQQAIPTVVSSERKK